MHFVSCSFATGNISRARSDWPSGRQKKPIKTNRLAESFELNSKRRERERKKIAEEKNCQQADLR